QSDEACCTADGLGSDQSSVAFFAEEVQHDFLLEVALPSGRTVDGRDGADRREHRSDPCLAGDPRIVAGFLCDSVLRVAPGPQDGSDVLGVRLSADYGISTTFPTFSRRWMKRCASAASPSGKDLPTCGLILPAA